MATAEPERFDEILGRLQGLVEKLEGGKLSIEESLAAFEEGVGLTRRGQGILDTAEKKIEVLARGESGDIRAEPMSVAEE